MPVRSGSPSSLAVTAAAAAAVVTVVVVAVPFVRFAYEAPSLHVALETVNAVVALLVAFLVYGRYRASGRVQELLLVLALATVAVANLVLTAVPTALAPNDEVSRWGPLAVRLLGTLLLVGAALTPTSVVVRQGSTKRPVLLVVLLVLGLGLLGQLLGDRLPPAVDPDVDLGGALRPVVAEHPVVLVVNGLSAVLYAVAAVAFTRQSARTDDELLRWVGAGCVLAAAARVHYLLFPSLYTEYVYTGDALRLAFYLMLLVGASREIRSFWEARAQTAVLEDRRRLARDLHDGLTQELTYIYAQTRHLEAHPDDRRAVARINDAAGRAIDEARTAIAALTRTDRPCFADVLRPTVDSLAGRYDVRAEVEVDDDLELPPDRTDAVLRIVGEAFRNAVRHGGASLVRVRLTGHELVVEDDGKGFAAAAPSTAGGFGLQSMRERAEGLGARLHIESGEGRGATVRVVWT